jgi:hypothetical protein
MAKESNNTDTLLNAVTTTGAGSSRSGRSGAKTFQAWGATTAGAGSATIAVQGSNDQGQTAWDTIGTITLTLGTAVTSDSFTSDDRYAVLRGNVTAISGTGAAVTLTMGY